MTYKAITAYLILSSAMFTSSSFASEGPRMARVLTNVSATICTDPERRSECYSIISAVAEMSRMVGETAANCGDDVSSDVCIYSKTDSLIIHNWYDAYGKK
ncbi:TPA: hypothetical protein ACF0W1_005117 [Klebsiella pneumoniae]